MPDLPTVTAADVIARHPCGDWAGRIPAFGERYRRDRWSALEILSVNEVPAEDRLWVCLDESVVPRRVLVRFACEVAADAMRLTGWTDPRSWGALDARLAYERGEIDAAAWSAAWSAAESAQIRLLRTLILLDLDGYDVLRGPIGGVVPRRVAA